MLRNNLSVAASVGGWSLETEDGTSVTIPPSTTIPVDGELRVYARSGQDTKDAIFAGIADSAFDGSQTVILHQPFSGAAVDRYDPPSEG